MSTNRHNPPADLTPEQRRWHKQAMIRRGIRYEPWPKMDALARGDAPNKLKECAGEGCTKLIVAKSGAKYCSACNFEQYKIRNRKGANKRYHRKRAARTGRTAKQNAADRERYARKKQEREAA